MAKETTKKRTKTTKKTAPQSAAAKATAKAAAAKAATAKSAVEDAQAAVKTAKRAVKAAEAPIVAPIEEKLSGANVKAASAKRATKATAGPSSTIKKLNYWLAFLYGAQAIAIVLLGNKISVPITAQYPALDTLGSEAAGHQLVGGAFRHLFDMELGWAVATFLIVFATIRYMAARKTRVQDQPGTDRGVSAMRWMSFGLGGGVIVLTIALLTGIYEIGTLLALFALTAMSAVLAFAAEVVIDRNKGMWTRMARVLGNLSVVSLALPWVVFAIAAIGTALWNGHLPVYLYSIYGCVALLFFGTVLATYFYFARQGRWADPLYAERSFMLLELLTASFLAWQVFAGVLHA